MSTAVLDRVEALQVQAEYNRDSAWLELVTAFVDDELPADTEVVRLFRETGKGRTDLERDGALLREYRRLEEQLASVPKLQREYEELSKQLPIAMKSRDAADSALRKAVDELSRVDSATSIASGVLQVARSAERKMRDPKFNLLRGEPPMTAREQELRQAISELEGRLGSVASRIHAGQTNLARYDAELEAVDGREESTEEKNKQRTKLRASIDSANLQLNRHGDEQHDLKQQLRTLRQELAAEKS